MDGCENIALDDDDDGVGENDEEYNEIQESSAGALVLDGVPVTEEPAKMVISSVSSLRTPSVETSDSNQKAKKTFRPENQMEFNQEGDNKNRLKGAAWW